MKRTFPRERKFFVSRGSFPRKISNGRGEGISWYDFKKKTSEIKKRDIFSAESK